MTRFLDFARPLALRLEKTEITQVIDGAVAEVEKHLPSRDVTIHKSYSADIPPLLIDRQLMERVLYNLLLNAAEASPPKASVTVKTQQLGDTVEISVIDRGSGIAPKDRESIFNPFFTTKSSGVGLGLAIVSKIVDEHGGQIKVESEPGAGSVFRVLLSTWENGA
ncbi:MAG: GHKL domain-containing protein [Bryobacterales bacterium]|nr:GHKL domain-containing protein [Bryobacterales bacterium]